MFEQLAAAIEEVEVPATGAALAAARRLLDRLEARIANAEADYAASGAFEVDGYGSMATFERHACRVTVTESRRLARRAARLAAWPELGQAWRAGTVTGAQVELACAKVPERHTDRFAQTLPATIEVIAPLTAHHTGVVLGHWARTADAFAEREAVEAGTEPRREAPARELSAHRSLDDELVLRGGIDADGAVHVEAALRAATRPDLDGERRTPAQRRADALVEVCRGYLAALADADGGRRRERVTLVADVVTLHRAWLRGAGVRTADDLEGFLSARPHLGPVDRGLFLDAFAGRGAPATTLDGHPVTEALLAAVAADGAMELLLTAGGQLLHLGRSTRTFSPTQRRAVLARDQGCRTAGCDAGPEHCDVHHVVPWERGGPTDVGNAVAKCHRCHLEHHRRRWRDRLDPDGTYVVTTEHGVELVSHPPGAPAVPRLPVATTAPPATAPPAPRPCGCECEHHPGREYAAVLAHDRRVVLDRARRELGLAA